MDEPEDKWLLKRLGAGDREAFRLLYDRHVRSIYAVALRLTGSYEDAEEAAHDAFMDLMRQGAKAEQIDHLRAWLLRVAMRRATDMMRLRQRQPQHQEGGDVLELDALGLHTAHPRETLESRDLISRVRHLARELPERQGIAFSLRHFQGFSVAEVAAAMECSEGAVKAHLHLALKRMRELLRAEGLLETKDDKQGEAKG